MSAPNMLLRDGVYHYLRRVPYDVTDHDDVKRLCFCVKTKSGASAYRAAPHNIQTLSTPMTASPSQNHP